MLPPLKKAGTVQPAIIPWVNIHSGKSPVLKVNSWLLIFDRSSDVCVKRGEHMKREREALMDPITSIIASYRSSLRRSVRRKHEIYATVKRALDILVVCATALAVMLVIAVAASAILIAEGRPVFFVHNRVGRGGRVFPMLRLRTMKPTWDADRTATLETTLALLRLDDFSGDLTLMSCHRSGTSCWAT